jgi:hypothetical protein
MANRNPFDLNSGCVNYTNINQGFIHITEDKLKVILLEHKDKNSQFYSWTTPFGIFVSCLLATITSNFGETWGISASTWEAIFLLCTAGTGVWSICAGINAYKHRKGRTTDDLIEKIKNSESA